ARAAAVHPERGRAVGWERRIKAIASAEASQLRIPAIADAVHPDVPGIIAEVYNGGYQRFEDSIHPDVPGSDPSLPPGRPPALRMNCHSRYLYPNPYTVSIRSNEASTSSNLRRRRLMWLSMVRSLT